MARKYYIPITRSGSSILASLLTQSIERSRKPPNRRPSTPGEMLYFFINWALMIFILFHDFPGDTIILWLQLMIAIVMLCKFKAER